MALCTEIEIGQKWIYFSVKLDHIAPVLPFNPISRVQNEYCGRLKWNLPSQGGTIFHLRGQARFWRYCHDLPTFYGCLKSLTMNIAKLYCNWKSCSHKKIRLFSQFQFALECSRCLVALCCRGANSIRFL